MPSAEAIACSKLPQSPESAEDQAFTDYIDGLSITPDSAEFSDYQGEAIRFDECAPIQLERRGVTSQISEQTAPRPISRGQDLSNLKPKQWQAEFWAAQTVHKNAVAAKLRECGRDDLAGILEECHSHYTIAQCSDCGRVNRFPNRCDSGWCPECQPRLAGERRKAVEWWTRLISQPKHVVLTVKNFPDFTKGHVQEFKRWWSKLRRRKFAKGWRGGCYSLEVTNEGRGWHLHLHALVDADWIDAGQLAIEWNKVTNGLGNIVKVKDAREHGYLQEVAKYAVKGSELAKWTGPEIAQFISAIDGVRTFGVFGSLYGARTEFAEFIATLRDAKPKCECGSCNVRYYSEAEWMVQDFKPTIPMDPKPPRPDYQTPELFAFSTCAAAIAR